MEDPRVDADPRSPKRTAQAPACAAAALDASVWTCIIEFVPMPTDLELVEADGARRSRRKRMQYNESKVSEVVATWKTLLNLRLVSQELAELLHPAASTALWKRLVLQNFDFSVGGDSFNLENCIEEHGLEDPEDEGEEGAEDETNGERAEANPQLVAMRGRYDDMPGEYLEEDLHKWLKLGIYHRPSQYGFLTTLQQSPGGSEWPQEEDAFTLFGDLVRLLQLPYGESMEAGGEGGDPLIKCLVAPTEAGSSSVYFRFYVMKTLGYVPHFWQWGRGIGNEWMGFTEPDTLKGVLSRQFVDKNNSFDDQYDQFGFPSCTVGEASQLFDHIRQYCKDWRSVCCNEGSDGTTPVFFVGESKAQPHRWIGYVSEKTWT